MLLLALFGEQSRSSDVSKESEADVGAGTSRESVLVSGIGVRSELQAVANSVAAATPIVTVARDLLIC